MVSELRLTIDAGQFRGLLDAALRGVAAFLNAAFARMVPILRTAAAEFVEEAVLASPEVISLLAGSLRNKLGLVDAAGAVRGVLEAVKAAIGVTHEPVRVAGQGLTGGLSVGILRSDLTDALSARSARFQSEKGFDVPWLEWLLTGGENILLLDYQYIGKTTPASRTGTGIMARVGQKGKPFRLPGDAAGTAENNFLSRALAAASDRLVAAVTKALTQAL